MIKPTDLHAFVDGELSSQDHAKLKSQIEGSSEASNEVVAIRNLKTVLQNNTAAIPFDQAWKSCVRRLDEMDKARRVERVVGRLAPGLCGLFFVAIVLGGFLERRHGLDTAPKMNVSTLLPLRSTAYSQADKDKIEWYTNLINQSRMPAPDHMFIGQIFEYTVGGVPVTKITAHDGLGNLVFLLIPNTVEFADMTPMDSHPDFLIGRSGDTNCIARLGGNNTAVVIANRSYDDLASVMAQIPDDIGTVMTRVQAR